MLIDTRYRESLAIVEMVLQSARERALSDADLMRVAMNQDKLRWLSPQGKVAVTQAALCESLTGEQTFEVQRDGDRVRVLLREREAMPAAA